MTDLDARVAALMALVNDYACAYTDEAPMAHMRLEQAIRAELQKPALHEAVTSDEVLTMAGHGATPQECAYIRQGLESFLQGRAKPAQEEITDAEIMKLWSDIHEASVRSGLIGLQVATFARAIIRASKGEK